MITLLESPGIIRHLGVQPTIHIGEMGGANASGRVQRIQEALPGNGIKVVVDDNIETGLWKKFILMSAWGSVGAVSRAPIGAIHSAPKSRALLISVILECRNVGLAKGVSLPDDVADRTTTLLNSLPDSGTSSLQRDLAAGRRSELDDWTGAALRMSDEVGHPVPHLRTIYAALLPLELRARGIKVRGL